MIFECEYCKQAIRDDLRIVRNHNNVSVAVHADCMKMYQARTRRRRVKK